MRPAQQFLGQPCHETSPKHLAHCLYFNPFSNFTTTTNRVELTPFAYPSSNVRVTPVLDGVSYPQLTSSVGLSNIRSVTISGNSKLCTDSDFTFNNLLASQTITWSLSDSSAANISDPNSNPVSLIVTGSGATTLTATIFNSCGQSYQKSKNIIVGEPQAFKISIGSQEEELCDIKYHYIPYYLPN